MRIAFITPEFVTNEYFSGGLANYVHRVSRAIAEMGHEVHVSCHFFACSNILIL